MAALREQWVHDEAELSAEESRQAEAFDAFAFPQEKERVLACMEGRIVEGDRTYYTTDQAYEIAKRWTGQDFGQDVSAWRACFDGQADRYSLRQATWFVLGAPHAQVFLEVIMLEWAERGGTLDDWDNLESLRRSVEEQRWRPAPRRGEGQP
jgi:hypothetical protein